MHCRGTTCLPVGAELPCRQREIHTALMAPLRGPAPDIGAGARQKTFPYKYTTGIILSALSYITTSSLERVCHPLMLG